ncbi:heme biosynthesis protein HemY, partial [Vibrio anguillarum]|nr:heme biosynthesis protein HemY [Vibrio anguillarum]
KQQVREEEFELALSTLSALQATHPNNTIVLNLLKITYVHLEQWQPLLELLPKLQKAKQIDTDESQQL